MPRGPSTPARTQPPGRPARSLASPAATPIVLRSIGSRPATSRSSRGPARTRTSALQAEAPRTEAPAGAAGRGHPEGSRPLRECGEGEGRGVVRPSGCDQGPGRRVGHRHDGQHITHGAAQRHDALPVGAAGAPAAVRLARRPPIAVVAVAVARPLQPGAGPRVAGRSNAREGDGTPRAGQVGRGVRRPPRSCR